MWLCKFWRLAPFTEILSSYFMFLNIYVCKPTTVAGLFFLNAGINLFLCQYCLVDCQGTRSYVFFTSGFLSRQTAQYCALTMGTSTDLSFCLFFIFISKQLIMFFQLDFPSCEVVQQAWCSIHTVLQVQGTVYRAQIWFRKGHYAYTFFINSLVQKFIIQSHDVF